MQQDQPKLSGGVEGGCVTFAMACRQRDDRCAAPVLFRVFLQPVFFVFIGLSWTSLRASSELIRELLA